MLYISVCTNVLPPCMSACASHKPHCIAYTRLAGNLPALRTTDVGATRHLRLDQEQLPEGISGPPGGVPRAALRLHAEQHRDRHCGQPCGCDQNSLHE